MPKPPSLQERLAGTQRGQGQDQNVHQARQVLARDHKLTEQEQDKAQRALGLDGTSLMSMLSRWGPVVVKVIQEILSNLPDTHQVGQNAPRQQSQQPTPAPQEQAPQPEEDT